MTVNAVGRGAVQMLIETEAFVETGKFKPLMGIPFENGVLQALVNEGIISARRNYEEFGDVELSLNLTAVKPSACVLAVASQPLLHKPLGQDYFAKASKVELLQHMLLAGWRPAGVVRGWSPGKRRVMSNVWRPRSYYHALGMGDEIFKKPGGLEKIFHWGPDA